MHCSPLTERFQKPIDNFPDTLTIHGFWLGGLQRDWKFKAYLADVGGLDSLAPT
jgi:hypothetical protein